MKKIFPVLLIAVLFSTGCSLFEGDPRGGYGYGIKTAPIPRAPEKSPRVFEDDSKSLRVTNMTEGQLLPNGFTVKGEGVAFESSISWRLEDGDGTSLGSGYTMIAQPDVGVPGPFYIPVFFDRAPSFTTGTMLVFENSAKDGSEIHVVRIPVTLSTKTQTVTVFFGNSLKNPHALDCTLVYGVKRQIPEGRLPFIAVDALLQGPTDVEKNQGYYTSLPSGVVLIHTEDNDGFAIVDFDQTLQQDVAGSCRVSAIRSQIEHTIRENNGGQDVPITINGKRDDILQP